MITLALTVVGVYMLGWFIIGQLLKRNDVADIAWGLGFVVLAWVLYFNRPSVQLSLATLLVTIWGIRLSVHIFMRNRKKSEDYRYKQWREEWGKWFLLRSLMQVFLLQGLLLTVISAPVVVLGKNGLDSISPINFVGVLIWAFGFVFESVGDYQLSQFIAGGRKKGEILQTGLWRYTRHPNYFGEVTQWWGIWLIAYGSPWFWYAVIGPLTITLLILKVSGIPMLERRYAGDKAYEVYKKRTSMFIPMPQKKG